MRVGGAWSGPQRLKNDLLWAIATAALAATRSLPVDVLRALGARLGAASHAALGGARSTALSNVTRVFPDRSEPERRALVRRCFVTLGETLGETAALLRDARRPEPLAMTAEAREMLREARGGGRGVLFVSAHLGPWELVAASMVAAGVPLVALARESYDPRFSRLYDGIRRRAGVGVVWRGSPGAAGAIVRTLRSGGVLGVPMDLRSRVESREVPFLGHPAPTPIGPARIALKTRAAVVVGSIAPAGSAGLAVTASVCATSDLVPTEAGALELTARINAELSRRILALPHAWVWMHERWTAGAEL